MMIGRADPTAAGELLSGFAPILVTGLSHTGKTELRRVLERHPDVWMTRKSKAWERATTRARQRHAAVGSAAEARRRGHARWGIQLKELDRSALTLLALLEDARVLHLVRDPAATLTDRGPGRRGWALARWVSSARRAAAHELHYPGRYRIVGVESIVADPARALASICAFLDLPWCEELEEGLREVDWRRLGSPEVAPDRGLGRLGRAERTMLGYEAPAIRPGAADFVDAAAYLAARAWDTVVGWWVRS